MKIVKGKYYKYKHPNGFVLKALDDSTSENFRGFVVLKGDFNYEVGHEDHIWSVSRFVESDLSEFLEEANKRYPIGSQYYCVGGDDLGVKGKGVAIVQYEARLWRHDGDLKGIEMGNFMVYNFKVNKWAERVVENDRDILDGSDKSLRFLPSDESRVSVFVENDLFNMDTKEGRLAFAKQNYPIGTEFLNKKGEYRKVTGIPRSYSRTTIDVEAMNEDGEGGLYPDIYCEGYGWCEIIKKGETKVMGTQKLTRQGLKEIHGVACSNWKDVLEQYGGRNPLEDYIELSQKEIDEMFKACTPEQLPIVSKYLKQDDGSVDVTKFTVSEKGFCDDNFYIIRDREQGEYKSKSFLLSEKYNWKIKRDVLNQLCLIPTTKK